MLRGLKTAVREGIGSRDSKRVVGFELLLSDGRLDSHRINRTGILTVIASVAAVVCGREAPAPLLLWIR